MMLSPLALMHPQGSADSVSVIGSHCPPRLCAQTQPAASGASAALVVIAPNALECQQPGWLHQAIATASQCLKPDGLMYVAVPMRLRITAMRLLQQHRFTLAAPCLHLPNWEASRYIVPLSPQPAHYAFQKLIPTAANKRWLLLLALRLPFAQTLLAGTLPSVALLAHRGLPPFAWLFDLDRAASPSLLNQKHNVIVSSSWRKQSVSVVLHGFGTGAAPITVAKIVDAAPTGQTTREADALTHIGPTARRAGANVPQVLQTVRLGAYNVLLQSVLPGQTAATRLTENPEQLPAVLQRLSNWLAAWGQQTRTTLDGASAIRLLTRCVLEPANQLRLPDAATYQAWLSHRCAALQTALPCVAAHNDLTLWNVLLDNAGALNIVDWQEASATALPLTDFVYAALDAVALAHRWNRLRAFKACFAPDGAFTAHVQQGLQQLQQALQLSPELSELCVHACFLGHATNEAARSEDDAPKPFLEIAAWLATHHQEFEGWLRP